MTHQVRRERMLGPVALIPFVEIYMGVSPDIIVTANKW